MTGAKDRRLTVGAFGMLTWDKLAMVDAFPEPGSYRVVRRTMEQSGGTTGNMAVALAKLGVSVSLASRVGDDENGARILEELQHAGCDTEHVQKTPGTPTDHGFIIVSGSGAKADRSILWFQGARLKHGDHLPIEQFFARDLVIVDIDDLRLRTLLLDLPMHVSPRTRMFGTLTFLAEHSPAQALELALRHDYLAGNAAEMHYITGESRLEAAIGRFQDEMILSQVRFAAISDGSDGCYMVTRNDARHVPAYLIEAVDPTGAGDAFAAGVAFGILNRWEPQRTGRFANAVGALATRALGARSSLPDLAEIEAFQSTFKNESNHADGNQAN